MSNLRYEFDRFTVTLGQSNPDLDIVLEGLGRSEWFILTAENPNGEEFPFFINKQRTQVFEDQLMQLGILFYKGLGRCDDDAVPDEHCFLLLGITREEAGGLALQFDQLSFLTAQRGQLPMLIQPSH